MSDFSAGDYQQSDLYGYVVRNQPDQVQGWLDANPNAHTDRDNAHLMHQVLRVAVRAGCHDIAEKLLQHGAEPDPNEDAPDFDEDSSAVAEARERDDWRMVNLLLEYGANDMALSPMEIHRANTHYFQPETDRLPDINLADYVMMGDAGAVKAWLEQHPDSNPNDLAPDQMKPALMIAVNRGDYESAQILLEYGANPNLPDRQYGYGALHEAVSNNDLRMVNLLLAYGADVNQPSDDILATPLHMAAADRRPESVPVLHRLLDSDQSNPDIRDASGNTALHYAAATPFVEKAEKLVAAGASWRVLNNSGETPLACAEAHNAPAADFLRTKMADDLKRTLDIDLGEWRNRGADGPNPNPGPGLS